MNGTKLSSSLFERIIRDKNKISLILFICYFINEWNETNEFNYVNGLFNSSFVVIIYFYETKSSTNKQKKQN